MDPTDATYSWSTGETSATIIISEGGTYTVVVTSGNCTSEDTINVAARTDLDISLGDDFKSCHGETILLTATTSEEGISYEWRLNGTLLPNTENTLEILDISDDAFGTYEVIITKGACTGTDDITISSYAIGNCIISQGLSPGGTTGFNDSLDLEFLNDRTGISKLQIFNRYGTLVFEKNDYINEWFGQDKNDNDLPTGTYYYVIDLLGNDDVYGTQPTGWIYLNRDAN